MTCESQALLAVATALLNTGTDRPAPEGPRHTVHDDSAPPSDVAKAMRDYAKVARVRVGGEQEIISRLNAILRLLDGGHVNSARAMVEATISDLGGEA